MNSKTSWYDKFFSKAIIRADIRNNWVWSAVMTVIFVLNTMSVPSTFDEYYSSSHTTLQNFFVVPLFFAILYALFLGARVFSYLNKPNSVSNMHGLPFSRGLLYRSHLASGMILICFPILVTNLIMMMLSSSCAVLSGRNILILLATYIIYTFLSFAISAFSMTVCGNVVVSTLFSCTIAVMPAALLTFIYTICEMNFYGFSTDGGGIFASILEFLYIIPQDLFPWNFLTYVVFAAVFFVGGYFVYRIRPLENCEEVVAFKKLRWLFIYTVGIVCGMVSYMFFLSVFEVQALVGMLPLGIIGVVVSTMIAKKSANLKGTLRHVLIFTLFICLASASVSFDIIGFEKKVPKVSDVKYVEIGYARHVVGQGTPDNKVERPEDIEKIITLHKAYIAGENSRDEDREYAGFTFEYHLKNGSTLVRRYNYLRGEDADKYLLDVYNIDEYKKKEFTIADDIEKEILSVLITDTGIFDYSAYFTDDDALKLYEAVVSDINRLSYDKLCANGTLRLRFNYYEPEKDALKPVTIEEKEKYSRYATVYIGEHFTQTLKVLEELGVPEETGDIEKVSAVVVNREDKYGPTDIYITDAEQIKEICTLVSLGTRNYFTFEQQKNTEYLTFNFIDENNEYMWSYGLPFLPEEMPDYLKK